MHLTSLTGGWSLWRTIWLRSAGFPAELLEKLAAPETAAALDGGDPHAAELYEKENAAIGAALRDAAKDPQFREALLWQNRKMVHGSIAALLRRPAGATDSKTREHERLMASYVQRYAAKNETIGFFGPVAWAQIGEATELEPGDQLLARRNVRFERWAIAALGETITKNRAARIFFAPQILPTLRLEGSSLIQANGARVNLPDHVTELLTRCDGFATARQIAEKLAGQEPFESEEDIFDALEELADRRIVSWRIEIPVWNASPEKTLSAAIEQIEDPDCKAEARSMLAELEAEREKIRAAAGDPEALDAALASLEQTFERLTGGPSSRREGQAYAGRTIIYEDCVRDVACTFGPKFTEKLGPPLELILLSARWFSARIAAKLEEVVRQEYRSLAAEKETIDYLQLWSRLDPYFYGGQNDGLIQNAAREVAQRWAEILLTKTGHHLHHDSQQIAAKVRETFAAETPGWPAARHHSPDILVAAKSIEAFDRGEVTFVLGELHAAVASLLSLVGVAQHPQPEKLFAAAAQDVPETLLTPVESETHSTRADYVPLKPEDPQLEVTTSRALRNAVRAADLIVREAQGHFTIETRDGSSKIDLMQCLGQYLSFAAISRFQILPEKNHTPRVTIDDLIVARERWRFTPAEMPWLAIEDRLQRFAAGRAWAKQKNIPRFVFVKVPEEPKPYYLDWNSPIFMEIFARRGKKAAHITLSEMLPSPEDLWLTDKKGQKYTSELRMVAVDPKPWVRRDPR